jgi:3-methyladenine DNA glycosylase Tag
MDIISGHGSLFRFVYGFKHPDRLYKALIKYGFTEIKEENVSWLMKNIGVIEAHEPAASRNRSRQEDNRRCSFPYPNAGRGRCA